MSLIDDKDRFEKLIHFVGIGGIGMSGIAEIMISLGYKIQGSDTKQDENTKRLENRGVRIFHSHCKNNIINFNVSYLVVSRAIRQDNVELVEAIKLNIPIIDRGKMLADLMLNKYCITIAGAHGKTTTTSLVACLFESAGISPTVVNGGIINSRLTNAYLGTSDYFIAEADESDETFIRVPSNISITTNIDKEHLDYYKSFDNLVEAFTKYIKNPPLDGLSVVCIDNQIVRSIVNQITDRNIITYGINSSDAHLIAYNIKLYEKYSQFDIKYENRLNRSEIVIVKDIIISIPGKHNVLNSLAAIAVGFYLNFEFDTIKNAFKKFNGVKRRMTKVRDYKLSEIIDDYAHHPSEIEATLATTKLIANNKNGRVIAIFQPHRYSRFSLLLNELSNCFNDANKIFVTEIYSSGEEPIEGVSSHLLVENLINNGKDAQYVSNKNDIEEIISSDAQKGDLFIFMGAGNITNWANDLKLK